jgi:hypothetical protein
MNLDELKKICELENSCPEIYIESDVLGIDGAAFANASRAAMPLLITVAEAATKLTEVRFEPSDMDERDALHALDKAVVALKAYGVEVPKL